MNFQLLIEQIVNDFMDAWNHRDMDKVSLFLSANVCARSPYISRIYPENSDNLLRSKELVMQYYRKLNAEHFFPMKLLVLTKQDKTLNVEIDIGSELSKMYAIFIIDEYGKFTHVEISYTQSTISE